jgi:hypothetical protein
VGCGLLPSLCVCPWLPRVRSSLCFLVIQHPSELVRQSNTGRLVERLISGARCLSWGAKDQPFDTSAFADDRIRRVVLFPRGSLELGAHDAARDGRALELVLLDGSWYHAGRMARRIPELRGLPFVALPAGAPSSWPLRRARKAHHLSTLEAAIRAVEVVDGEAAARPLRLALELVAVRGLHMRGKLNRREMEARSSALVAALERLQQTSQGHSGDESMPARGKPCG